MSGERRGGELGGLLALERRQQPKPGGTAAIESGRPSGRRGVNKATSTEARSRSARSARSPSSPLSQTHVRPGVRAEVAFAIDQDRRNPADQELLDYGKRGRRLAAARRAQKSGVPGQLGRLDRHRLAATIGGRADDQADRTATGLVQSARRRSRSRTRSRRLSDLAAVLPVVGVGSIWPIQVQDRPQRVEAGQGAGLA